MPWGIAAGIVPKNAFSENREFQTFYQYFAFHISLSLCRIGQLISLQFERIFRYWFCIRCSKPLPCRFADLGGEPLKEEISYTDIHYTKFGIIAASNASVATDATPLISAKVEMRVFCLLSRCPNSLWYKNDATPAID